MERVNVLVIDDEEDVRSLLTRHLTDLGCAVRSAADGTEGLRLAAAQPPDLVILDILLPGTGGHEVFHRLRTDPLTSSCRIVLASVLDREDLVGLGADAILPKPFLRSDLVAVCHRLSRTVKEGP